MGHEQFVKELFNSEKKHCAIWTTWVNLSSTSSFEMLPMDFFHVYRTSNFRSEDTTLHLLVSWPGWIYGVYWEPCDWPIYVYIRSYKLWLNQYSIYFSDEVVWCKKLYHEVDTVQWFISLLYLLSLYYLLLTLQMLSISKFYVDIKFTLRLIQNVSHTYAKHFFSRSSIGI